MSSVNPFRRYTPLSEENALKVDISRLTSDQLPNDFNDAIDILMGIQDTLQVVQKVGKLNELGMFNYYLDALRWLNFEMSLSNFIGVQQIGKYSDIDANIASQFKRYVEGYNTQLNGNTLFIAVEASRIAFQQRISKPAQKEVERLEQDAFDTLHKTTGELLGNFNTEIGSISNGATANVQNARNDAENAIETKTLQAVSAIQAAQALQSWEGAYSAAIAEYRRRLFGQQWGYGTLSRNFQSWIRLKEENKTKYSNTIFRIFITTVKTIWICLKNASSLIRFSLSWLRSYNGRRTFWFVILAIFVILFVVMSIAEIFQLQKVLFIDTTHLVANENQPWYAKYTVYIPVVVLLGLAYSFSVKNYRIYSNMLDQYEHRRTVASTAQGIILSLRDGQDNDLKDKVTAAAAAALFEHKNTGHLTKNESESLSLFDVLKSTKN